MNQAGSLAQPNGCWTNYSQNMRDPCISTKVMRWEQEAGQQLDTLVTLNGLHSQPKCNSLSVPHNYNRRTLQTSMSQGTNNSPWHSHRRLSLPGNICRAVKVTVYYEWRYIFLVPFRLQDATCLTFRHPASYILDRHTAAPQSTLFIYLVSKYI